MSDAFHQTVGNRYRALQARVRKFYGLNVPLPYSADEYERWILIQLGTPDGFTRCAYCKAVVHFGTMITEHRVPLEQAGKLDLGNLCIACDPCNQQKGAMMPLAFSALRELGLNRKIFTEADWDSLRGRLQSQLKLALRVQAAQRRNLEKARIVPHQRHAG